MKSVDLLHDEDVRVEFGKSLYYKRRSFVEIKVLSGDFVVEVDGIAGGKDVVTHYREYLGFVRYHVCFRAALAGDLVELVLIFLDLILSVGL